MKAERKCMKMVLQPFSKVFQTGKTEKNKSDGSFYHRFCSYISIQD